MSRASAYEQVTRTKLDGVIDKVENMERTMNTGFAEVKGQIAELFNHQSNRWAPNAGWAMTGMGGVVGAIITAFIFKILGL